MVDEHDNGEVLGVIAGPGCNLLEALFEQVAAGSIVPVGQADGLHTEKPFSASFRITTIGVPAF